MRILTRYILGEVISHALIGAAVFTFVLFTRDLGRILELVVRNSAPLPSVAQVFLYSVPVALTYTIPMGVLVGILIGLSRLAADSEITAMRASGLGVWTFLRVISIFVVVAWMLALVNSVYLAPRSLAALGDLQDRLKGSQASFEIQPRVFYEGFPKAVLYVQDVKAVSGAALWKGVFLADLSQPSAPRITLAREGILVSQGPDTLDLHLSSGSTHETNSKNADQYQISTFQTTDIPIRVPAAQNGQEHEPASVGEMKVSDLRHLANTATPVRAADRLHCARSGRHSAGTFRQARRQVHWICPDDPAGISLLFVLPDRSLTGSAGAGIAGDWRLDGGRCVSDGRRFSIVDVGAPAHGSHQLAHLAQDAQAGCPEGRTVASRPAREHCGAPFPALAFIQYPFSNHPRRLRVARLRALPGDDRGHFRDAAVAVHSV
jgi:lipopolysaccharide export LptBFGC system permease protein LptF